jgi:hypothetical protein
VVRNGYHAEREVITASGAVAVRAPRVNDKRIDEDSGQRTAFRVGNPAGSTNANAVNAPHLVALVRAGAQFDKGILIEQNHQPRPQPGGDQQVASHAHPQVLTIPH